MAYSEWYQGYLRQEQEEALRRERGASRQHATFSQKPPAPRPATPPPSVQAQLAAMATVVYAARRSMANRDGGADAQEVPFGLSGDSIYRYRAAQVSAHRQAARGNPSQQPARHGVPVMPDADSIYLRRKMEAQGLG